MACMCSCFLTADHSETYLQAETLTLSAIATSVPVALASFVALPFAWGAYAITMVALASFAKHFLTGRIEAGVHKYALSHPSKTTSIESRQVGH